MIPFKGVSFSIKCVQLWPFSNWLTRRVDTFQLIDRARRVQKSTFDIDVFKARVIPALEMNEHFRPTSCNSYESYVVPLLFRRNDVITDIDTIAHTGRPFHVCKRAVNISFQAHLIVGLVLEYTSLAPISENQLERLYRFAVSYLTNPNSDEGSQLKNQVSKFGLNRIQITEIIHLLERFETNYIQCVELPLGTNDGTIVVKVKLTDTQWEHGALEI